MPFGGGTFTKYDKFLPGTYTNTITIGAPSPTAARGTVAAALKLDWGADDEVFTITAQDFLENAESLTGYTYADPKNMPLREIFKHASTAVVYKLNADGSEKATNTKVGTARYSGKAGNNITVTCYKNANNEEQYDVRTYFNSVLKDTQTVDEETIEEVVLTKGTEKTGTTVETATATFAFDKNTIKVTFANVPEGYKHSVRIKGQVGILAFTPGRMEETVDGLVHTVSYYPGAAINGEMTVEAVLTKDRVTVINSCTYTCKQQKTTQSGAPTNSLDNNDFVAFTPNKIIAEGAGYVFEGGTSSTSVNAGAYSNFLNAVEPRAFDVLVYDGDDKQVKALFAEFTRRLREERGKYFQTVLYNYSDADYEGVISVYNKVKTDSNTNKSSLVNWFAGYSSSIAYDNELTSKLYDGELEVDTSITEAQLELLTKQGNVVFHKVSDTEVYTLFDVNTLTTFTEEKDSQLSENKVVRIVDYVHNAESYQLNRYDIGKTPNTEEGRALIWNECYDILSDLQASGAITDFSAANLTIEPVASDKHAVKIDQSFTVTGTIYRIYITTYVVQ